MTKHDLEESQNLGVRYVGIKALRELQQNCITLDEVAYEAAVQLFRFAPITIVDQIPVFTKWVENALKGSTLSRKKNYSYRRRNY
jgi:hypothetical protein